MHKIDKFLSRLDQVQRDKILVVILQIQLGNLENLNIKKLKGEIAHYRVRVGKCRIIFEASQVSFNLISIEFRSDNTY